MVAEVAAAAPGAMMRRSLHRTAALSALTAALAAQRAQRPAAGFLTRAQDHAEAAGDGPLTAQALMLQRDVTWSADPHRGVPSKASVHLLGAALHAAGSGRNTASLRAGVRHRLACEWAALGNPHAALAELEAADVEVAVSNASPDHVQDTDLRCGAAAAWGGGTLIETGRPAAAEAALTEALSSRVNPAGVLVNIARLRVAAGDVDGAAIALREALLAARAVEDRRAESRTRAVAATLPDCAAVRELLAVIA